MVRLDEAELAKLLDQVDAHTDVAATELSRSPPSRGGRRGMRQVASTGRLPPLSRQAVTTAEPPQRTAVRLSPAAQKFAWTDPGRNHMRAAMAAGGTTSQMATRANTPTDGSRARSRSSDPAGLWTPGGALGTPNGPRGKLLEGKSSLTASMGCVGRPARRRHPCPTPCASHGCSPPTRHSPAAERRAHAAP